MRRAPAAQFYAILMPLYCYRAAYSKKRDMLLMPDAAMPLLSFIDW